MRLEEGVKALLSASQIAVGEANGVNIRVYGEKASMRWVQMDPNRLIIKSGGNREEIIHIGGNQPDLGKAAYGTSALRAVTPGFIEAFANIYRNFTLTVMAHRSGEQPTPRDAGLPERTGWRAGHAVHRNNRESGGWNDEQKWVKWEE